MLEKTIHLKFCSLARTLLIAGTVAGMVLAVTPSRAQDDPPPGSARFAHLEGNVSVQPDGTDNWGQAYNNMPANPGDRIYTDQQAEGELQAAQVRAYFSPNSDLTLVNISSAGVELGVAQGSSSIYSDGFGPNAWLSVQTPNGAVAIAGRAGFRIDTYPDQQSTVITNFQNWGALSLSGGGGFEMTLNPGESVQLSGTNPVYAQPLQPAPYDEFSHWSNGFEGHRFNSISARYVSTEMPGYDELDNNGDWRPESDYGPIWFPRVEVGWAPYRYGHWVNRPFYGWTWVADEPWGAAPFHYGRWVQIEGRWGWIPGPREQHPVWSPAQVVFAGGIHVGGIGVSVWFPLGPGEAYKPWYPCSPQYVDRINITNIHESRVVHVQNTYINVVNVTNVTYINRTSVTAVRQEDFAAGRSTRNVVVKVDPREVEHVQPARPEARPPAQPIILHPVAKPAAVAQQRPVLINTKGQQVEASPHAKPVPVPVKAAPPAPKPLPGRAPVGTPTLGGKPVAAPARPAAQPVTPQPASKPEPVRQVPTPPEPAKPQPVRPTPPASTVPSPSTSKPQPVRPSAPQEKLPPTPPAKPTTLPAARPEPVTPQKPAESRPVPPPPSRPQPPAPETRPANPNGAKPAPAPKDNKKPENKKLEDKKPEDKKQ